MLNIREITQSDKEAVCEFFDNMGGESRALFNRRDYNRRGVLKFLEKGDNTRRYFLAEQDGKMAGYVFFLDFNTSVVELGLALRDDLKGKHLGRELVSFAIDYAREHNKGGIILTTHLANIRGQALYEAMGFKCMGQCKNGSELLYLYRFIEK